MVEFIKDRLVAASGALGLGMPDLANDELEDIPPAHRLHREVLVMRAMVYQRAEAWELMYEVSRFLAETWPEDAQHWIWVAYATRRCRSVEEAEVWLKRAREAHPTEPTIPYNLSCYAAVTGRIEEAKQLLERAIRLDANVRMMALEDPDLEPLWESFAVNTEP
jgi:tetratricopeptide (TPR) repeat protein